MKAAIALEGIASKVGYLGDKAVEPLIQALNDKSYLVRVHAVRTLGIIRAEKAIAPLKIISKSHKDLTSAAEAERALKRILENQTGR
jgi:HEAT repeat protein